MLVSGQAVTFSASVDGGFGTFRSVAHFYADANGFVDVDTAESVGGTYKG